MEQSLPEDAPSFFDTTHTQISCKCSTHVQLLSSRFNSHEAKITACVTYIYMSASRADLKSDAKQLFIQADTETSRRKFQLQRHRRNALLYMEARAQAAQLTNCASGMPPSTALHSDCGTTRRGLATSPTVTARPHQRSG